MAGWSPTRTMAWVMTSEAALVLLLIIYALFASDPDGTVLLGAIVLIVLWPIVVWSASWVRNGGDPADKPG